MFRLWFTQTSKSFSHRLLSNQVLLILCLCIWFFLPKCRILHWSLLKFILFVSLSSPSCQDNMESCLWLQRYYLPCPVWHHLMSILISSPFELFIKMLNNAGLRTKSCGIPLFASLQNDKAPLIRILWVLILDWAGYRKLHNLCCFMLWCRVKALLMAAANQDCGTTQRVSSAEQNAQAWQQEERHSPQLCCSKAVWGFIA